ncbi:hypothetical protein HOLleu_09874 [Holothuria leucospilota]|uniref:Uncharacterized protein n=1 Tax=Holothuria leucospilota TaxID=206669 RepID=A0A9Q1HFB1_HOLLE|nr:hypothetical protein HOLleu_09874 [Holothuria leucospilota]
MLKKKLPEWALVKKVSKKDLRQPIFSREQRNQVTVEWPKAESFPMVKRQEQNRAAINEPWRIGRVKWCNRHVAHHIAS